jgi:hypothetical protein
MTCTYNRCYIQGGKYTKKNKKNRDRMKRKKHLGGSKHIIPPAQHSAYPAGATSPSEAAIMNGQSNIDSQSKMINSFNGGSGHQPIVVPQHQELASNQSGNQGANETTVNVAKALTQGNENASMDELVGGGHFSIHHSKKPYGQAPKTHTTQGSIPRPMGRGGKKTKRNKFKKHYMWNTKGKRYMAKTYKQHIRGAKLGHTHTKPKKKSKKMRKSRK